MARSILRRGFKGEAERLAIKYREEIGIHVCAPLCAFKLARHLNITVYYPDEILTSYSDIVDLTGANSDDGEWSGVMVPTKAGNKIIIHNPEHSPARQQSNVMHELAHVICEHKGNQKDYGFELPFGMQAINPVEEEEAKCLGATLQLARPCLLWAKKRSMTNDQIALYFTASVEMVRYRKNMLGLYRS